MLVRDFLEASVDRVPDKTALVCDHRRVSYAEVEAGANRVAHALRGMGVQRGDRVVILLPNTVETVLSIFGTLKAGSVFVVINPTTKQDKLIYILNNCRGTVLITEARQRAMLEAVQAAVPSLKAVVLTGARAQANEDRSIYAFNDVLSAQSSDRPPRRNIDQDLACLIYTSGSTGDPKGVVSGHNNVVFASGSIIQYLENTPDDIVINVLPLSFDYGLYQLLMTFRFGGTLVLEKSFAFPAAVMQRIEEERVTGLPGVPTVFALMLQMELDRYDLSSVRYLTNTAAALPPEHVRTLRQHFPMAKLYAMYGLTECKRALYLPPDQADIRPGSVGIPIPGTEAWIEDDEGHRVRPGVVGELVIRGSHVMRGYWEDEAATARAYRPGPTPGERILYSGDYFRSDEEGYFYFVSRKDDIIKSRGEKVSPKEIEDVLYALSGVTQAAVIGVPDPILGQAIKAFVVVQDGEITESVILRHCRKHLESFLVPQYIEFRDRLPVSSNGKIIKRGLS